MTAMRKRSMPLKLLQRQLAGHDDVAGGEAAIDREDDAGDRGGGIGGEEADGVGDVDGIDDAAERIPAAKPAQHLGIALHALLPDRRANRARADDIGADAVAAIFERKRLGQADHAGLAGAVAGSPRADKPLTEPIL